MKRSARFGFLLAMMLVNSVAKAGEFELPNYDAYEDAQVVAPRTLAPGQMLGVHLGGVTGRDVKRHVPTFFGAPKYGPVAPSAHTGKPEDSARFYLEMYGSLYGTDRTALKSARIAQLVCPIGVGLVNRNEHDTCPGRSIS